MYVDKKSPIPVYYQLRSIILKKISNGEYPAGSLIPSERNLSENLKISRMTVRQALSELVNEGILKREKGKGTFVSHSKIEQRNIMSFSDMVRSRGMVPGTKVLNFIREGHYKEIESKLELENSEHIFYVRRLRLAGETPVGIEEEFIPEKYFPGLAEADFTGSFYRLIKEKYNYSIDYVDNVIEASRPDKEEKNLLKINSDIPLLRISGINYTRTGIKLFYENSIYRSDEYKYNIRVNHEIKYYGG